MQKSVKVPQFPSPILKFCSYSIARSVHLIIILIIIIRIIIITISLSAAAAACRSVRLSVCLSHVLTGRIKRRRRWLRSASARNLGTYVAVDAAVVSSTNFPKGLVAVVTVRPRNPQTRDRERERERESERVIG